MESHDAVAAFTALGHDGRLAVFRLLVRRAPIGAPAGEIASALRMRPSTLSAHLTVLVGAGLISGLREGRTIRYRARLDGAAELMRFLARDCCRGRPDLCAAIGGDVAVDREVCNVLFICTGNSARSIMAEAILRDLGGARFNAYSAGTRPLPEPNPLAVQLLERQGHDVSGLRAKHVSEFQAEGAPEMDAVVTVCDRVADEDCRPWTGQPITGHWGLPDPARVEGDESIRGRAFHDTYRALRKRLSALVELPIVQLDGIALQHAIDEAAAIPAAGA